MLPVRTLPLLLLGMTAMAAAACDHIPEQVEQREVVLKERLAIEHYAKVVPETWPSQEAWVSAAVSASALKTPEAMGKAFEQHVVPALQRYGQQLGEMPVMSPELERIHAQMVTAHRDLAAAYGAFAQGLDYKNYKERRAALAADVARFHSAERDYLQKLEAHFDRHGVARLPDPPIRIAAVDVSG